MRTKTQPKPQKYRLKAAFPKLQLAAGSHVYKHPKHDYGPGRFAAALEPRADGCSFPVMESEVEAVPEAVAA